MPRWKPRWKIVLIIIVLIIIIIVGLQAMHGSGSRRGGPAGRGANHQAPVPVTVVPVEQKSVPVYLNATGTVQALYTVTVQPQVGGRLLSINFEEGQEVEKGDVLAEIDPRSYQATYDQDVARMHSDQAQLATARGNLARSKELIKQHYVSQQDLNTQANTVKQLEATVAADRAMVEDARIQLNYTKIRAPISGLAGIRQVDPGNVLTTNSAIVVLTHVRPINVVFALPAKDLDRVRAAQKESPLPVAAMDRTDNHVLAADGVLKVIDNRIDPDSGTFTLKSQFPNEHTELWPGQFVNVRMKLDTVENGLVIPTQAVERGPDGDYVYLLTKDNTVDMQPVVIGGDADDTHVLVEKGLAAGDKVVTEGQFRLKPGSKVTPLKPGEVPVPATSAPGKAKAAKAGKGKSQASHK
ncbi:MAG TPA: efflux RND transporter periplasmic adaptor subunit [Rhodanobacteraceae bacterium]|nr:efflux RND transporter periplasmic adaptor subunit [Rhodanobacteraceae bacterium]